MLSQSKRRTSQASKEKLTPRLYALMTVTTLLTFTTLTTGYELFFTSSPFA